MKNVYVHSYDSDSKSEQVLILKSFGGTAQVYRTVRKTSPNHSELTEMAAWLFDHCPTHVHGKMSGSVKIKCFSGLTEKDRLLVDFENKSAAQQQRILNIIRCYGESLDQQESIDWLFPVITPTESDAQYWNNVAEAMKSANVKRIVINDSEYIVS